jgi:hypothetical protein
MAVRTSIGSHGLPPALMKSKTFSCAPLFCPLISPNCAEA